MDYSILVWPLQALISAFSAVLWHQLQETKKKAEKAEQDLHAFKIETFSTFMTRGELQHMFENINKALESTAARTEQRLDKFETYLMAERK